MDRSALPERECAELARTSHVRGGQTATRLHLKVVETEEPFLDIDMSSTKDVLWLFNLFIDPMESYAVGHRQNAWLASLGEGDQGAHENLREVSAEKRWPGEEVGGIYSASALT